MSIFFSRRWRLRVLPSLWMAVVMAISGCANQQAMREARELAAGGQAEAAISRLEQAVAAEPKNAELRIALARTRADTVSRYMAAGDAAHREGRLVDAEKAYRQALSIEPNLVQARQALGQLTIDRRHKQAVAEAEVLWKQGSATALSDAMQKLRPILAENPEQPDALNLKARIDDARARLPKAETKLAASFRKPISLEFRDAPLKSVFDLISKVSGLNFFFDKDVRPDIKATIQAKMPSTIPMKRKVFSM